MDNRRLKIEITKSIKKAFSTLEEVVFNSNNAHLLNQLLNARGRYNSLQKKVLQGVISSEDAIVEENKIRTNLLEIADDVYWKNNLQQKPNKVEKGSWIEDKLTGHSAFAEYFYENSDFYHFAFSEIIKVQEEETKLLLLVLFISSENKLRKLEYIEIDFNAIIGLDMRNEDIFPSDINGDSIDRYPSKLDLINIVIYMSSSLEKGLKPGFQKNINERVSNKSEQLIPFNSKEIAKEVFEYLDNKWKGIL